MRPNHPLSRIANQLMWDRLISVVEEQAQTLVRTAFGTPTREAGDLSAGVYDTRGRMLAQAVTGTPGHVNSMARSVDHVLAKIPLERMAEGDVFVLNDPWQGTGHLNDIVIVTPTFRHGKAVGLFADTLHVVDIGGRGIMGAAKQVYEEGLYIPITKIVDRGEVNRWLIDLIAANVREPVQVIGDIYSLIASNEIGGRRLIAMMDEFELEHLDDLARHILDHSRAASLAAIARLTPGTYRNEMTVDGFDGKPMTLRAQLTVGPDGIDVDYAGSPGVVAQGLNVPLCYTEAYTSFGVKCIIAPRVPNNAGSLATIRTTAPEGCILNARHPAPVAARSTIGHLLPDVVFGCLIQALPDSVPAEGTSGLWNLRLMGGPGRVEGDPAVLAKATPFNITSFHSGGTGARPRADGLSATAFPSGVRNVPVEVTETLAPVVIWKKEFRQDSGGAGEHRGGLGQVMEIASVEGMPFGISATFERVVYPPRGRLGGQPGAAGRVELVSSGKSLPPKSHSSIPMGERLRISMPGGGGYGDPKKRPVEKVAADVERGLVSVDKARELYGVALTDDFKVDQAETAKLRAPIAAE
ncbi:hydantoinase B/oxoprolinase family protein [Enhydrobacter sp.]|jgi:N-methylhydantoinase B|uniref:hydantoinase B/oxoprolinase family protein n=1 Tax=Enhydrobacter sp. TaxID=1894999 RepID=UPI00262918D4|nr:hydantoinase B/oxoprolinase family protein [Enhydrobacter sp.]WIM11322.1 MAG: N-methylhydantoinase B [Enhydrobacter sp.]